MQSILQRAVQDYADRYRIMVIRRYDSEEVTFLDNNACTSARILYRTSYYSPPIEEDLGNGIIRTNIVLERIPAIDGVDEIFWEFSHLRNIVVRDIRIERTLIRYLTGDTSSDQPGNATG